MILNFFSLHEQLKTYDVLNLGGGARSLASRLHPSWPALTNLSTPRNWWLVVTCQDDTIQVYIMQQQTWTSHWYTYRIMSHGHVNFISLSAVHSWVACVILINCVWGNRCIRIRYTQPLDWHPRPTYTPTKPYTSGWWMYMPQS